MADLKSVENVENILKIGDVRHIKLTGLGLVGQDTVYVKFFSSDADVQGILGKPDDVIKLTQLYGEKTMIGVSMSMKYIGDTEIKGQMYKQWSRVA